MTPEACPVFKCVAIGVRITAAHEYCTTKVVTASKWCLYEAKKGLNEAFLF